MIELPDGSGVFTGAFALPKGHWLYADAEWDAERDERTDLPEPILDRSQYEKAVRAAAQYAIRAATMQGQDMDFDPDALVLNFIYALCGPIGNKVKHDESSDPTDLYTADEQSLGEFQEGC